MIRQSQNYFAAAISAAILNAAAIAAFVVFTMLSSAGGFPLQDLFGSGNTITSASSPGPSGDGEASRFDRSPDAAAGSRSATPGTASGGPAADTQLNGADRASNGSIDVSPSAGSVGSAPSGGSGPAGAGGGSSSGSTGGGGGAIDGVGGAGGGTALPSLPQQPAQQQIGGAVSELPSSVNQGVGNAVDAADDAVGGGLNQTGAAQVVKGASNSLLGPNSAVGQTANNVGGALQGPRNRVASAPQAPVSVPKPPAPLG